MRPGTDQEHFVRRHVIDQKPVGFDMAFPNALPFSRQLVRAKTGWQGAVLGQPFDGGDEVFQVIAAAFLSPEVLAELRPLGDSPHRALLQGTDLLRPSRSRIEGLDILARPDFLDGAARLLVRNAHGKGHALGEADLGEEQCDRLAGSQPDPLEHGFGIPLQSRFDPRPDGFCLAHAHMPDFRSVAHKGYIASFQGPRQCRAKPQSGRTQITCRPRALK